MKLTKNFFKKTISEEIKKDFKGDKYDGYLYIKNL